MIARSASARRGREKQHQQRGEGEKRGKRAQSLGDDRMQRRTDRCEMEERSRSAGVEEGKRRDKGDGEGDDRGAAGLKRALRNGVNNPYLSCRQPGVVKATRCGSYPNDAPSRLRFILP
ncbi:hypothetical protein VTN00DRAFT_3600 [Thermoascus crustaceus]|uniref:uncharacterized protein n=1 Tax=Thermoascus crustaceus TaxID=5088 RepID=UPI0037425C4F